MVIFYDFVFFIFALFYLPYAVIRGKWHRDFGMRFGFFTRAMRDRLAGQENLWIHAVSVGEVMAVSSFAQDLTQRFPDKRLVISTVTTTGQEMARKRFPDAVVLYAPLDFSGSVRRYLRMIKPQIYIAAETEIWPNIFYALSRAGVPVLQINGRISDKSYPRYRRFAWAFRSILSYVTCFCMQTRQDADRLMAIGAPPERICVTGNLKFDEAGEASQRRYGKIFCDDGPVLIAGSTHPGEEEIILRVFRRLRFRFERLRLVLAPRHIERIAQVEALIKHSGLGYGKFSDVLEQHKPAQDVLLVDTIGHLRHLYAYATVTFIGKTLAGRGGQNVIEPALCGCPVIVGPHTENFRAVVALFQEAQALIVVQNADELYHRLQEFFANPSLARETGSRACRLIESQRGAVQRTLEVVIPFLR